MSDLVVHIEISLDEFSSTFLNAAHFNTNQRSKPLPETPFESLSHADDMQDTQVAEKFITAVNSLSLTPGYVVSSAECSFLQTEGTPQSPTAGMVPFLHMPKDNKPYWADQTVPIHFFSHEDGADPFAECKAAKHTVLARERKRRFEQISKTAELLFAAQHRVCLLSIVVIGRKFRLLRWDRAGLVVTPATDYYEEPAALCDALGRLSFLDSVLLGYDMTATRLRSGDPEFRKMTAVAEKNKDDLDHGERRIKHKLEGTPVFLYIRYLFRKSISADWPLYILRVKDGDKVYTHLVGKPFTREHGVIGRGRQGFVAFCCETGCFGWLKDLWRPSGVLFEKEGDILRSLNEAGIPNVPTLVCHGDILGQATVTDRMWKPKCAPSRAPSLPFPMAPPALGMESSAGKKRKRGDENTAEDGSQLDAPPAYNTRQSFHNQHYRIVIGEIAMTFAFLNNGKQMVSFIRDCLRAQHSAATNPKTLRFHGDISADNMLICPRICPKGKHDYVVWSGLLIDWELSMPTTSNHVPQLVKGYRMGTRKYMPVSLLNSLRPATAADELECFLHVLIVSAVTHLSSNCKKPKAWADVYVASRGKPTQPHASALTNTNDLKSSTINNGYPSILDSQEKIVFGSPMDWLITGLLDRFRAYYLVSEYDKQQARASSPSLSPSDSRVNAACDPMAEADKQQARTPSSPSSSPSDNRVNAAGGPMTEADNLKRTAEIIALTAQGKMPTDEDRSLASEVTDPALILEFIEEMLARPGWPEDDLGDSSSSHKKRRTQGEPTPAKKKPSHLRHTNIDPLESLLKWARAQGLQGGAPPTQRFSAPRRA